MKRLLLLISVLALLTPSMLTAAPCASNGTLATLLALGSTGCTVNGLLFTNFGFAPSASGTGIIPVPGQMSYILLSPAQATNGQNIWGFDFNPGLSVIGAGSEDILLTYTIIDTLDQRIGSIHLLLNAATTGAATATVAEGPNRACTGVNTGCVNLPTITASITNPHVDLLGIGPYTEIDVIKNINVTSNAGGSASMSLVRDAVDLVPEPADLVLLGTGLMGLGMLGRRRKSRA